ncbi:HAUS augmin-like complex subunit 5 isoform X1 [Zonotrichia albicollis]|uniref:HAUS augmin-like complex subunit 5 isoform X1 n=1 Tax=Zonotrichia albicollis TaxID=44394 RepID=UPI003D8115C2
MAEALERWLREEMELPPSAVPSPAALRRLCSGPTAPIWDYITRHVQNQRNAKKIRGNLRWYRHLQELEAAPAPPGQQGALRAALERLRNELQDLGDAIADAQETAQRLEASLEEAQSRRWAELERGAELRLLGAEPGPAGLGDCHKGALRATHKSPGQSRGELSAILAAGAEPEVLVSIKALCKAREVELQRPHPHRAAHHPGKAQEAPDWSEQAEAVLIGHSPEAVLWALEVLANQSTRALLASPAPSAEAPPTLKSLLQECWGAVGGVWGALPPLLSLLRGQLGTHLERGMGTNGVTRQFLLREGLSACRASLGRALTQLQQELQNPPQNSAPKPPNPQNSAFPKSQNWDPKSSDLASKSAPKSALKPQNLDPESPNLDLKSQNLDPKCPNLAPKSPDLTPNSALEQLRQQLWRGRGQVLHLQQRLRFLSAATRGRRAALKPLQEQVVGVARAGPGSAPPPLEGAWLRRRQLALGALGALGAEPRPPAQATPPLWGLAQEMGVAQGSLLSQAAILRQQLRQGALCLRWGAGPVLGAEPEPPASPPLTEGVAELLPQLRLVREDCEQRIRDWPRLQELVSQWWAQPAQWVLATPPGCAPFSHWLQCWRAATHALQATPTPEEVPPTIGNGGE